ncbi:unnamed protein product [Adineta ricciae]|uniref:F-box domain-containing protein n=1 Tax=Adineta ricciae TaxID=249248 RepID=A0A814NMI2_ADIRI|nr:unnamed protein product [Adineta ricciae]CAF1534046.1 unnamed protein product [Adineta ricciae]
MSDNQTVTNIEVLPNEILIECFQYLDALQIFSSFDQLNSRFNELIRRTPLYVDFRNFSPSLCQQICEAMLLDPTMKEYIYSLHLSNKDTGMRIESFRRMFALEEFSRLQSLTLIGVNQLSYEILMLMLASMTSLTCFHLKDSNIDLDEIVSSLHRSIIQIITLPRLPKDLTLLGHFASLRSFTIDTCNAWQLIQVLNAIPTLKYLQINYLSREVAESDKINLKKFTHSLRHLVINKTTFKVCDIKMIIAHTPNLNRLTLFADFIYDLFECQKWERLFHTYLSHLKVFQFCFQFNHKGYQSNVEERLQAFHNYFQRYVHSRFIESMLSCDKAMICTVPYAFATFELYSGMNRYHELAIDHQNMFSNVTQLTIHQNSMKTDERYSSFSFLRSERWSFVREYMLGPLKANDILSMVKNFSHVKYLDVSHVFKFESPSVLVEILRETPRVSSLTISFDTVNSSLNDDELCQYLKRMIRNLHITKLWNFLRLRHDDIQLKFCEVFSNLDQLTCTVQKTCQMIFLLTHLPKLLRAQFIVTEWNPYIDISSLNTCLRESDIHVDIVYGEDKPQQITFFIDREMTDNSTTSSTQ